MAFFARCLLFTPANHPERFSKAHELGADGIIRVLSKPYEM